jgi:hypothetical protein
MRRLHQGLGNFAVHPRQANVEPTSEGVSAVGWAKIHFGINCRANRRT